MVLRKGFPSLETLSRIHLSQLTLDALTNVLVHEEAERTSERKWRSHQCKRKRSYSTGDQTQGELNWHKKLKTRDNADSEGNPASNKRRLDTDDYTRDHKRTKLEEGCKSLLTKKEYSDHGGEMSKDDATVRYFEATDACHSIRRYFLPLPHALWNQYGKTLINHTLGRIGLEALEDKALSKVVEYIFCEKLTSFSTQAIENYASELDGIVYDKLRHCRRLVSLEVTITPRGERDVVASTLALQKLRHLQALSLLPTDRYSFHWAVGEVTQHCQALRGLKLVYNGDLFQAADDLGSLTRCGSLTSLWLFNFGRRSETKQVSLLLKSLNLKVLFHKELPNAILELALTNEENVSDRGHENPEEGVSGQGAEVSSMETEEGATGSEARQDVRVAGTELGLERVDLCWHQRGLGYQLVYVPSSYLVRLARVCPKLTLLNLVGPPCLAQVLNSLPSLKVLALQQASLDSCLTCSLHRQHLSRLTELLVSDVWDVTHDLVSAVACGCPSLRVLSVVNSSLEARGDLSVPPHRPPFPSLQQLILVPTMLHSRPALTTPAVWQLGKNLTSYILDGASMLVTLHLQYKVEDLALGDTPTRRDLEDVLSCPRPGLRTLVLEWPPAVSNNLVEAVTLACPTLTTFGAITTWPITSRQCAALVARYGRSIDIT